MGQNPGEQEASFQIEINSFNDFAKDQVNGSSKAASENEESTPVPPKEVRDETQKSLAEPKPLVQRVAPQPMGFEIEEDHLDEDLWYEKTGVSTHNVSSSSAVQAQSKAKTAPAASNATAQVQKAPKPAPAAKPVLAVAVPVVNNTTALAAAPTAKAKTILAPTNATTLVSLVKK